MTKTDEERDRPYTPLTEAEVRRKAAWASVVVGLMGGGLSLFGGVLAMSRAWVEAAGVGLIGLMLGHFVVQDFLWHRRNRRGERWMEAGCCPMCGADLGGNFDRPCPHCHFGEGVVGVAPPKEERPPQRVYGVRTRGERERWGFGVAEVARGEVTLRWTWFELEPVAGEDGSVLFADHQSTFPGMAIMGVVAVLFLVFSAGWVSVMLAAGEPWDSLGTFFGIGVISALFLPLLLWGLSAFRRARASSRTVTISPVTGAVVDVRRTRRGVESGEGRLEEVGFSVSVCSGFESGASRRSEGVVLWAPLGPMLLACREVPKIDWYVERLPDWLRERERLDPAVVRFVGGRGKRRGSHHPHHDGAEDER